MQAIGLAAGNSFGIRDEIAYLWGTFLSAIPVIGFSFFFNEKISLRGRFTKYDLLTIMLGAALSIVAMTYEQLLGARSDEPSPVIFYLSSSSFFLRLTWLFCAAFLGPLIEEILFRHFLLRIFLKKFKPSVAVVLNGAAFVAPHMLQTSQIHSIICIFILGTSCAIIKTKSNNIRHSIQFHSAYNLTICCWVLVSHDYLQ